MSQWQVSFSGLQIPSSFETNIGFGIQAVTVYNNTPAQVALASGIPGSGPGFPYGAILIPAFYPITVPVQGWKGVGYITDGTVPFATSSLLIIASDQVPGGQPLSPFGPSGWGAGGTPNALVAVNPGDPILAWQVQQLIDLLTGVMTGQGGVTIADGLNITGQAGFPATGLAVAHFATFSDIVQVAGALRAQSYLELSEKAAPGTPTGRGRLYTALDGSLHYLGPAGTNTLIAVA